MGRQLTTHGPLDLGPLFVGQPPAIHQQVSQRQTGLGCPACTGLGEIVGVYCPVLKSDNAEEEIALGVYHSLTLH